MKVGFIDICDEVFKGATGNDKETVFVDISSNNGEAYTCICKEDAEKIIKHLQAVFKIAV